MVFLTITPTILAALEDSRNLNLDGDLSHGLKQTSQSTSVNQDEKQAAAKADKGYPYTDENNTPNKGSVDRKGAGRYTEPSLEHPKLGDPISHGQVIDLWKVLKAPQDQPRSLDSLLRGSRVYNPLPKPKQEPTAEYKALMSRLRREEEERSYHRMTNPPPPMETFAQHFPLSSAAHAFASSRQPIRTSNPDDDDEVTYSDVNRQVTLIFNVLVSIFACAGALWVVSKWWSTPARIALSMAGSLLVGIAEVVVYSGYIRRVSESKAREKGIKEVKEVVKTWVVSAGDESAGGDALEEPTAIKEKLDDGDFKAKKRKKAVK